MNSWQRQFQSWTQEKQPDSSFKMLLYDERLVHVALAKAVAARNDSVLIILPNPNDVENIAAGLSSLLKLSGEKRPVIPLPEVSPARHLWIPENEAGRCAALQNAIEEIPSIYVTTPSVLLAKTIAPKNFKSSSFTLKKGDSISPAVLAEKLVALDYDNELEVHDPGEFSRRGGIFDIYSPLYDAPVRIDFWGDEIDTLKFFLPDTQRSFKDVEELRIIPRGTAVLDSDQTTSAYVKDFFSKDINAILVDTIRINDHVVCFMESTAAAAWEKLQKSYKRRIELVISPENAIKTSETSVRITAVSLGSELADTIPELGDGAALWHWQQLRDSIGRWLETKHTVVACCAEQGEVDRLKQLLSQDAVASKFDIIIERFPLPEGVLFPEAKLVLLSSHELFGRKGRIRRKKVIDYRHDTTIRNTNDLDEGAFVVHVVHGIAIFRGIKMIESLGDVQEVMELEFADEAKLYVPLEEAFLVSRYLGAGKAQPKLSKINGVAWRNAKSNAAEAAKDLAAELLRIEAMRQNSKGNSLKPVVEWENSFANSFPYTETPDQADAIKTVLEDMEKEKPMDRLLCGDVGYGKTEVAMRAAFRAVLNGKQVAVLVPTTVLAQQHYQTFKERMAEYPVTIDMVSRFRTPAEQSEVLSKVASGEVDILIGTHRIIQPDVHFSSLGLLIIDEEQRFGVQHKQQLKGMRADLDVLTMTATPIPRTLYFSISGIRNLSTIMTAPVDRLPVTTIVANYDKELIRLAIMRELERGGQVFFLYNRVQTISDMQKVIQELVPNARCAIAHGQMTPTSLENVMTRFVKKEIDVLVCTTIIESGVDIPNVNTIIIDRADRFGLSELYQLRGRVGRHFQQAYAYMLLPPMGALVQNARERMNAIRRYTHLGAGFKLAMRDLEIRGAGNILGTEQSGHIAAVGFELYCQLLKDAVNGLTSRQSKEPPKCKIHLDRVAFAVRSNSGKTPIGLPPDYIPDLNERIDCYKRLSHMTTEKELRAFKDELRDRFGEIPETVLDLLDYNSMAIAANKKHIISLSIANGKILVETTRGLFRDRHSQIPSSVALDGRAQISEAMAVINRFIF